MLETDLYSLLSQDATLLAAMGEQPSVWLNAIPKGQPDSNALVIQVIHTQRPTAYDGVNALTVKRVQFDCYHVKASQSIALAQAVAGVIGKLSGALSTTRVQGAIFGNEIDLGWEPGDSGYVFRRMVEFEIVYTDL